MAIGLQRVQPEWQGIAHFVSTARKGTRLGNELDESLEGFIK